jgi:hypothetical protein
MTNSFNKARTMTQGILLLVISPIGLLGLAAFAGQGDVLMSLMFGTVTLLTIALGIWLIRRARQM